MKSQYKIMTRRTVIALMLLATALEAKAQSIAFTYVPRSGSPNPVTGVVAGADPSTFGVALFINVFGRWWTKPYWSTPIMPVNSDGTFSIEYANVTPPGQDTQSYSVVISGFQFRPLKRPKLAVAKIDMAAVTLTLRYGR